MIIITAPTGRIGHQVLDNVLDSAETIRVIARDPSRLSSRVRERVEVVQGSHNDISVVTEAFAGADSVLWLVPPNPHAQNAQDYYLDFTRPACEAIKGQGVKRVIGVSSLGRAFGKNAGLLSPAYAMDDLIESTGVSYRALRMPFFMENLLNQVEAIKSKGMFFMANLGDRKLATVATRDIAAVAAKLLLDDSWSEQGSVPVVGPDDLSPNDMARIISQVLERPVRFQQVSGADYKATMMRYGMTEAWARGLVDMAEAQNQGVYDAEQRTAPSTPTSFRQWCEEVLKTAVLA
ncbi:NmrA family NAD(P)-binding protein [Streptomyces sp. NPDC054933]